MKIYKLKYLTVILMLLFSINGFTQSTTFEFDKMNVAFKGLANQITVSIQKSENPAEIPILFSDYASFEFIDSTSNKVSTVFRYEGEFRKTGAYSILVKSKEGTLLIYNMRCKNIPDPIFMLDLKYDSGSIKKEFFQKAIGIGALSKNLDFDYRFKTKSYKCTVIENGEVVVNYDCQGIHFTDEMKAKFKTLKPGDIILFDEIVVVEEKGDERTIPSVHYIIE